MRTAIVIILIAVVSWFALMWLERSKARKNNDSLPKRKETAKSFGKLKRFYRRKSEEVSTVSSAVNQLNPRLDNSPNILADYNKYTMSRNETLAAVIMLAVPAALIGYIFYKNVSIALVLSSVGFLFPRMRRKQIIRMRQNKLNVQFKQALSCLASSMTAGKSMESAFREALEDLSVLYPDPACFIVVEFGIICRKIENGESIEAALMNFADRCHLEDVKSFADVVMTCKRTGGNLIEVMKRTSSIIGEKLEITQDIAVMVAQKKFESRVLLFAPIIIVAVLAFSSPDYMEPLYKGSGILIMSASLLVLAACFWITQKIMNIKV